MGTAILAENLGKEYRIGGRQEGYKTFREAVVETCISPFRRARNLIMGDASGASGLKETIWALKDVSFEIRQGDIVGIIGRNGSGKSTLLKILSQITEPTSGYAEVRGRVGSLLEVGTGFHPELTGRENIYLSGAILGMRKREIVKKFEEIVAFAEIDKFIDTPVKHYSSGMYLRLAFAVAAHLEPEILLVDEVLAVGDARFQKKCMNKMQDVGQEGRTVLFVSHNMPAVTRLCRNAVLLEEGRILQIGPSHKVVSAYLSSDAGTTAAREWEEKRAPGGEIARLRAVRVRSENGETTDKVDIREPVRIEMEYDVLKPGCRLLPVFYFHNEEGILVFESNDMDPAWRKKPRPAGHWKSTVYIPADFMAEGIVYVGAAMVTLDPVLGQFDEHDAVAFQVYDGNTGDSARGEWPGEIASAVMPLFKWRTEHEQGHAMTEASGAGRAGAR